MGDGLALAGGLSAAVYILIGRILRRKLSLLPYAVLCYGSAAAILWCIVLVCRLPFYGFSAQTTWAILGMAFVSQLIGHTTYNWGLRWLSAGVIAVLLLGEPIGSTLLAFVVFQEKLTWIKALGGSIILCAVYLAARSGRSESATPV